MRFSIRAPVRRDAPSRGIQIRDSIHAKTGCDLIPAPSLLMEQRGLASKKKDDKRTIALFPVITRKEFKFKTLDPDSKVNPFDTVLKGYVSRQRDEHIARENQVHFQARTIHETVERHARVAETNHARDWNDPSAKLSKEEKETRGIETGRRGGRARRTPIADPFSVVPKEKLVTRKIPKGFYQMAN